MEYANGDVIERIEDVEDSAGFGAHTALFLRSFGVGLRWTFVVALLPAVVVPLAIGQSDRFAAVWESIEGFAVAWAAVGSVVLGVSVVVAALTPRGRAALRYIAEHATHRRPGTVGTDGARIE